MRTAPAKSSGRSMRALIALAVCLCAFAIVAATVMVPSTASARTTIRYEVKKGDTVGEIAEKHGVRVKDIVRWNRLDSAHQIQIGQKLRIKVKGSSKKARSSRGMRTKRVTYVVRKGDTLSEIAKKNGVSTNRLLRWNRRLRKNPDRLRIGQKLTLKVKVPGDESESIGRANKGKLSGGERLPKGTGYLRRNSRRAYGTNLTVSHIVSVMKKYKRAFPEGPDFVIGDLSFKRGGYMKPHKSHQSGRDVDIGYVHADARQRRKFQRANTRTLDVEKNWYVIEQFLETGDVEYIFINYELQKPLYEYARKQGYSEKQLEKIFQYPNGKRSYKATIRHSRGHDGHMHVRFECPDDDKHCR